MARLMGIDLPRNKRVEVALTYIFGIGGHSNKALIEKAKSKMLENANLIGGARAIINLTTESHISIIYPIYFKRTITVSGHIVEFTD